MTLTTNTDPRIYRAPVRYAVSATSPIRIAGSSDPPFRIINLETSGTVWLSDNPGIKAGQGQPLRPGTSMLWVRPTSLFAICDTGTCEIILTTEIEDWQPDPAAIAEAVNSDQPERLVFGTMNTTPIQVTVDKFQCIELTVSFSSQAQTLVVDFADELGQNLRRLQIQSGFISLNAWRGTIPCHGTLMTLTLSTGTASVVAIGSLRRFTTVSQDILNRALTSSAFNTGNDLWLETNITLGAGASYTANLPPWYGTMTADVQFGCTAAMGQSHIRWDINQIGVGPFIFRRANINAIALTNVFVVTDTVPCCGDAYRFIVTNTTAVSFTAMNVKICATNGFGI